MLLQFSPFFPLYPPSTLHPQHSSIPPTLSSYPWVVHVSSLTPRFPIPFLSLPIYFMPTNYAASSLYLSPLLLPSPRPLKSLHVMSISWFCSCSSCFLRFCFHCFSFLLGSLVDSCEFVVILLFIFLIFFFLDKSL